MNLSKFNLNYLPLCLLPLLLLAALNYWNGLKTVDATLTSQAQQHLNSLSGEVDKRLQDELSELRRASFGSALRSFLIGKNLDTKITVPLEQVSDTSRLSSDLTGGLNSLFRGRGHFDRLAVFDQKRNSVLQLNSPQVDQERSRGVAYAPLAPVDSGSKSTEITTALTGAVLRCSVPITAIQGSDVVGSLVGELNLNEVIADTASVLGVKENSSSSQVFVTSVDNAARIIFNANRNLHHQVVSSALPEFLPIAEALSRNQSGVQRYDAPSGQSFITAFSPLPQWSIGLAVGYDRSPHTGRAHLWGVLGVVLALVGGVLGAFALSRHIDKKTRGMERVEEGLTAIAKGELDRRIDVKSSDDARVIADSINAMTEKMREQIAREEESRQFQTFVRLSAMLTHDLKNSIEALSLIVGNMEQHFDNPEFRTDAMKSLTSATDKLRGIVARLSRPLTSLSGEHPRPKSVDIIPILKRVAAKTVEPLSDRHLIEMNLPKHLFAYVDPLRIENVIENLMINALEAMADRNGKVTIEAGVTSRGAAMFSIADTGQGMSQTFIDSRLYRPFSTTKKNGVGLGLYTCRETVEASAGRIEVESREGAGTTFRVVLPSASHDSRN